LPIETLHAELIGNAESVTSDETLATDLEELVFVLANNLLENGTSANALADNMRNFSYLRSKWNEVEPLLNKFLTEADL